MILHSTTWWFESTYCSTSLFTSTSSIMLFIPITSYPLATLVYLCKLKMGVTHTHSYFCAKLHSSTIIILSWNSNSTSYAGFRPPIHSFRSPRIYNPYPLPTLSRFLPMSFKNLSLSSSPSLGPYPTTTQTLTFENLNLI